MAEVTQVHLYGNQLALFYNDGTRKLAYPTTGDVWLVRNGGTTPPPPGDGLVDQWTSIYGVTGDWEDHQSYSRGGTDWPVPFRQPLLAPCPGTIQNYPNIDGAGLKTMLVFDESYPRKLPASPTLMNGVYVENGTAPAVAMMFQHLDEQTLANGTHVNTGDPMCLAGDTGQTTGQHLHAHLLAAPDVGADRLDFMKFV